MDKAKKWLLLSVTLLVVGLTLEVAIQIVFVPRIMALRDAMLSWTDNSSAAPKPDASTFGLDATSYLFYGVLAFIGGASVFLGTSFVVILLLAKLLHQTDKLPWVG